MREHVVRSSKAQANDAAQKREEGAKFQKAELMKARMRYINDKMSDAELLITVRSCIQSCVLVEPWRGKRSWY